MGHVCIARPPRHMQTWYWMVVELSGGAEPFFSLPEHLLSFPFRAVASMGCSSPACWTSVVVDSCIQSVSMVHFSLRADMLFDGASYQPLVIMYFLIAFLQVNGKRSFLKVVEKELLFVTPALRDPFLRKQKTGFSLKVREHLLWQALTSKFFLTLVTKTAQILVFFSFSFCFDLTHQHVRYFSHQC